MAVATGVLVCVDADVAVAVATAVLVCVAADVALAVAADVGVAVAVATAVLVAVAELCVGDAWGVTEACGPGVLVACGVSVAVATAVGVAVVPGRAACRRSPYLSPSRPTSASAKASDCRSPCRSRSWPACGCSALTVLVAVATEVRVGEGV